MTETIFNALEPVLTRWTMGGGAAPVAPAAWRADLGTEAGEAELRLLALSGQFLGVLVTAEPQGELQILPDVPALAMPALPENLRPLARRILQVLGAARRQELLASLALRGWTLHPGDWMPAASDDDIPDVYAPWRDWAAAGAVARRAPEEALTAANWDDYWPAARNVALTALRRRDPAAATALIAVRLGAENADVRLRLLGLLATGLSDSDRTFLESLAADRAPKVKALAASLLARLGHGVAVGEEATELAGFFELQVKGLLRRTRILAARAVKTPAQRGRRLGLFDSVDLGAFAQAAGVAPEDLIARWPWGEEQDLDRALIAMAARSGSDEVIAALCAVLEVATVINVPVLLALLPRLDTVRRRQFAERILHASGGSFQTALAITGGTCLIDGAIDSVAGKALIAALAAEDAVKRPDIIAALQALGLLATGAAARAALDRLAAAGLLAADPRLDILRLNAALDDRGTR